MTWTKKHDEFALACNFSESMGYLARYQLRRGKLSEPTEIELNLKNFNKWVGKQRIRGEYHRKTLATAISNLDARSNGMFTILKSYSPWVHRVLVRPLSFVERIQRANCASTPEPVTRNPMFDAEHKKRVAQQQQQNISKIDTLLRKVGLKYDSDALNRIWRLAGSKIDNVVDAIETLLYRHNFKKVERPHGFIIECLKQGWQKGVDLYYEPELPRFNCKAEIVSYTMQLRERVKAKFGGETVYDSIRNRNQLRYQTAID